MKSFKKTRTFISGAFALACLFGFSNLSAAPQTMPVISRNCPAYVSSGTATGANDSNYSTTWRGSIPGWIAYDLSNAAANERTKIVIAWYNNDTYDYDHTVKSTSAYNNLKAYTIEGNTAVGGASCVPASGWVALVTVSDNTYHSRQHVVDFSGYNWLRLKVTESDGSSGNSDASINLDVHNAARGLEDDWIFLGDSITAGGMGVNNSGTGTFAQQINAVKPGYFPIAECGGIGGVFSTQGAQSIDTWLTLFPGKYVCLAYGTNDAWGNQTGPANYYNNLETMVKAIISAKKIPVVSKIPWSSLAAVQTNVPSYNAKIDKLYAAYPQIVKGPDFWYYFQNHPSLISSDGVHPSSDGYIALRAQWVATMLANVYNASSTASPSPSSITTLAPTSTPTPTATVTASTTTTPSPAATHTSGCQISYLIQNDWGGGASVNVTIKNNSATVINGWSLAWNFDGNQKISNLWNGAYNQSSANVIVSNASYNSTIAANGGTVNFGFNLVYTGTNVKPTHFKLNDTICIVK